MLQEGFLAGLPADAATSVGVVVGCSGGADSVALTLLLVEHFRTVHAHSSEGAPPLRIAHFNHGLRGEHSDGDEEFVRELAASLNVEMAVARAPVETVGEAEASLRRNRRQFFYRVAAQSGCRYIALAHTADDQAETILHHLLRGTGTLGMAGMRPASSFGSDFVILRPLLSTPRSAIRQSLIGRRQSWREDASNLSTRYTRNWIRHEVLPLMRTRFPHVESALARAAEHQGQQSEMLSRLAEQWIDAFVEISDGAPATTLKILRPGSSSELKTPRSWRHGDDLANEHGLIIAACQIAFDSVGWPRGDMSRHHWVRLAQAIAKPAVCSDAITRVETVSATASPTVSLGHWPGHIEGFQNAETVVLRSASRD